MNLLTASIRYIEQACLSGTSHDDVFTNKHVSPTRDKDFSSKAKSICQLADWNPARSPGNGETGATMFIQIQRKPHHDHAYSLQCL